MSLIWGGPIRRASLLLDTRRGIARLSGGTHIADHLQFSLSQRDLSCDFLVDGLSQSSAGCCSKRGPHEHLPGRYAAQHETSDSSDYRSPHDHVDTLILASDPHRHRTLTGRAAAGFGAV